MAHPICLIWLPQQPTCRLVKPFDQQVATSDVVLEDRPWPRGSSRTKNLVLGLGLGLESSGLGLEGRGLGLGLGLEGPGPWPWSWPRGSWP